jgi:hypothetical protein
MAPPTPYFFALDDTVIVAVVAVRVVQMTGYDVVGMAGMRQRFVPACIAMFVRFAM